MLGKLIKHDFFAMARLLGPAYIVMIAIALLGRLMTWLATRKALMEGAAPAIGHIISLLSSLLTIAYVIAPFVIIFLAGFYGIYRFYKNIFTDEGYLMNTLPTTPLNLVFSKLLNALIWMLFTLVIAAASWYISIGHIEALRDLLSQVWEAITTLFFSNKQAIHDELGVPMWVFALETLVLMLSWFARFAISWFFAVAFGQLISKNHKALGAIGVYIGLEIVSHIISSVYLGILGKFTKAAATNGLALQYTILGNSILYLLIAALLCWATTYIMKNRLNLD